MSLQPWRAFQPDGVILFSDILTPIAGMNIPFDITAGKGPVIFDPIRTMEVGARGRAGWGKRAARRGRGGGAGAAVAAAGMALAAAAASWQLGLLMRGCRETAGLCCAGDASERGAGVAPKPQPPLPAPPPLLLQQVKNVTPLVPEESVPFVGEALRQLRAEVGNQSTVLGFVGAPFTLATYIVEGECAPLAAVAALGFSSQGHRASSVRSLSRGVI